MKFKIFVLMVLTFVIFFNFSVSARRKRGSNDTDGRKFNSSEVVLTYLDTLNEDNELVLTQKDFNKITLADKSNDSSVEETVFLDGFRIQCFAANSIDAVRAEKNSLSSRIDMESSIAFVDPYYKLYVGNFDSREKAEKALTKVRASGYPQAWIVRTKINVKK